MWKRLKHPNVVPFLGVTIDPFQFVSEWMPNGTLTHYVTKNPGANRIALVSPFSTIITNQHKRSPQVLDVAEGLSYLHASYMIHGDLKGVSPLKIVPSNVPDSKTAQHSHKKRRPRLSG